MKFDEVKAAIRNHSISNVCSLWSKLATNNKEEKGKATKLPNSLDWKNMAEDTKMTKKVNGGERKEEKKKKIPGCCCGKFFVDHPVDHTFSVTFLVPNLETRLGDRQKRKGTHAEGMYGDTQDAKLDTVYAQYRYRSFGVGKSGIQYA